jgi:hypothetical protein
MNSLKGQCHEIFDFRIFHDYTIRAVSNFFHKIAEIFAAQGAPPVSLTPVANQKNLILTFFHMFKQSSQHTDKFFSSSSL